VLVSAPHACRHKRGGVWKPEDEYTGALALWLHQTTGAHALSITHQIDPDPHDDGDHNLYKRALADFVAAHPVRLILDLHGARPERPFGVCLGTMGGQTCPAYEELLLESFQAEGFNIAEAPQPLDIIAQNLPRFTGGLHQPTITRFAYERLHVPCVQVEINAWLRVARRLATSTNAQKGIAPHFQADPKRLARLLAALTLIVNSV